MARIPFSQRHGGAKPPQVGLQEMPGALRVSLWNAFQDWLFSDEVPGHTGRNLAQGVFDHIHWAADKVDYNAYVNRTKVKEWFSAASWHEVYEFIEWLPQLIAEGTPQDHGDSERIVNFARHFMDKIDAVLEREGAPYRWVGMDLVPIADEAELSEVDRAMDSPFGGGRQHIAQAVTLLSMKPEPDYRNTIKESVLAIESTLKEATGLPNGDLARLLAAFEAAHGELHPAFRKAVSALYGWTSDEGGVRHGIFGNVEVDHADARFMLVTCSAFVNFLVQHAQ